VFPWGRWLRGSSAEAVLTCSDLLPSAGTIGGQTARTADALPVIGSPPLGAGAALGGVGGSPPLPLFAMRRSPSGALLGGYGAGGVTGASLGVTPAYRITVFTSDVEGGGTDDDVVVVIYGEAGNTGELRLEGGPGAFERGRVRLKGAWVWVGVGVVGGLGCVQHYRN